MKPQSYGPFKYVPINRRPKLTWPQEARVALWVAPNLEVFHLDVGMPGDSNERPGPNAFAPQVRHWAQRDYGNRVGVFRIMEVLERHGIRATATLNSDLCDVCPEIIEDAVKLGWEFIGHCRTNTHRLTEIPPETERDMIFHVMDRIEKATGTRPKGWLGAGLQETWNSLDYLIEAGAEYVADWVNDDQPYLMNLNGKQLVSIPYSYEVNDAPVIIRGKHSPVEFERVIKDQFDILYREGEESGRVMAICLHPFVIGHPHRIGYLDRALSYIDSFDGVWKATGAEIVQHYLQSGAVV